MKLHLAHGKHEFFVRHPCTSVTLRYMSARGWIKVKFCGSRWMQLFSRKDEKQIEGQAHLPNPC